MFPIFSQSKHPQVRRRIRNTTPEHAVPRTLLFCFMASFPRPLFAQEIFPAISAHENTEETLLPMKDDVFDEVLVVALLAPLSQAKLRAETRRTISMSDASEQ